MSELSNVIWNEQKVLSIKKNSKEKKMAQFLIQHKLFLPVTKNILELKRDQSPTSKPVTLIRARATNEITTINLFS